MAAYFGLFEPDADKGGYVITFPDVPGCVTQGDSDEEAMEMAADALRMILGHMVSAGAQVPPAKTRRGKNYRQVNLPPLESAKLDLYKTFRASGLRKADLARRMGIQKSNVDRLFDLNHPSRFDLIDTAFRALGKRIVIQIVDAA
jgi:antitoxin HicB